MEDKRKAELLENLITYLCELIDDEDELVSVLLKNGFYAEEINYELWLKDDDAVVELCTFPCIDDYYCKVFYVRKGWLKTQLEDYENLEKFLEEYTWDETYSIHREAKADYRILYEEDQF